MAVKRDAEIANFNDTCLSVLEQDFMRRHLKNLLASGTMSTPLHLSH